MPTLYVENVPNELYEALRKRAHDHGTSIAAEVISLLSDNVPTAAQLARRQKFLKNANAMRSRKVSSSRPIRSAEELLREDRLR